MAETLSGAERRAPYILKETTVRTWASRKRKRVDDAAEAIASDVVW